MGEGMKWNCNACGMYVGPGHTCYEPSSEHKTEFERLVSLKDSYRRDLDRERDKSNKLHKENQRLREALRQCSRNHFDSPEEIPRIVERALEDE